MKTTENRLECDICEGTGVFVGRRCYECKGQGGWDASKRYRADVFCTNCGYEGPAEPVVGRHVSREPCPLCAYPGLRAQAQRDWDERERNLDPWSG